MKKAILVSLAILAAATLSLNAQGTYHKSGSALLHAGIGAGVSCVPISAGVDFTVFEFSPQVSMFAGLNTAFAIGTNVSVNHFYIGPEVGVNFALNDKFELYTKGVVGPYFVLAQYYHPHFWSAGAYVGANYYFSDNLGIGAYAGYGMPSFVGVRLNVKL
ncbi:MAG: hypothetical protein IJU68_05590 [Bacteroidales bacterium]|nr:hypothetical protein [Bacteroidales bacterium]